MCALDTDSVALQMIARIKAAALQRFDDSKRAVESDQTRRDRIVTLLQILNYELAAFGANRSEVEHKVGSAFSIPDKFGKILQEASLQQLIKL
jgi:hypothetical protein